MVIVLKKCCENCKFAKHIIDIDGLVDCQRDGHTKDNDMVCDKYMVKLSCKQMDVPKDKVRYAIINNTFPVPQAYFTTKDAALRIAKMEQPNDKPHYIIKCVESYEIVDVVK